MKKLFLIACVIAIGYSSIQDVMAQQDPQYTQYMYNVLSVNPAYAGNRGVTSVIGVHRSQWVGLEGAPRTQSLSIHSPFREGSKVGLGLSIVNDGLGPADETYLGVDFSYTINTSEEGRLSFGLKGGGHFLNVNWNELSIIDRTDGAFSENIDNKFSPLIGAGAYYHTDNFYFGVSVPNFLQTDHFESGSNSDNSSFVAEERLHIYGIVGRTFDFSDAVTFKPAALIKAVTCSPLQVDVSANFLLYQKLHLGLAYRWSAAVSAMAGFQVSDSMLLGIGYDRETTDLGNVVYNDGSFEVFLRFELFKKYDQLVTPRFF